MHRAIYNSCQPMDFSNFDFRNLSMHQPPKPAHRDYFNLKPSRASTSSPTSSLTADLDANFHIDKRYAPHSSLRVLEHCSPRQQPAGSDAQAFPLHHQCHPAR